MTQKQCFSFIILSFWLVQLFAQNNESLQLNDKEYFEMPGLNVMAFQDFYPEGHQGGISIIQNGERVATNGDIRLETSTGQWQPVPKQKQRIADKKNNEIRILLAYPDSGKNQKGFNPISYPDMNFNYTVVVKAEVNSIHITVNLDRPIPKVWIGKVGFNLELYPTALFGKTWYLDQQSGIFPRQPNGPSLTGNLKEPQPAPFASGKRLVVASESEYQRMVIESKKTNLDLIDGRFNQNNGWFIVRSLVPEGSTNAAIDWVISPKTIPNWKYKPVIHVSQVGYHPAQQKIAVIELDATDKTLNKASLMRISENGNTEEVFSEMPKLWGPFLRYQYFHFDFSSINREGMYIIKYGDSYTEPFQISKNVFKRNVWQPVLEYFLPIQMCHMRVNEKYRVWHGLCHMDDALMAPINHNHFDGYIQGSSTLTKYNPMEHINGLNAGGWHDAGDDDLRIESQAGEVYVLSLIYESFNINYDNTSIDEENKVVEIRQPDGKPDVLQQIEHGMIHVTNAYRSLGRLYRGVISPTLSQYVMMGDVSNQTDNLVYEPKMKEDEHIENHSGREDDRWVFTEVNPRREFEIIAYIAAASRVLKGYNNPLSEECLKIAEELWHSENPEKTETLNNSILASIELFITTGKDEYKKYIVSKEDSIKSRISLLGWSIGRILPKINDARFSATIHDAVAVFAKQLDSEKLQNPFGIPYKPWIWGAGWSIQKYGVSQYFLNKSFPDIVDKESALDALNFVLGCHPGENTASFASGIGARSMTIAYGYNRADWSYIPGGVVSGTALIQPDFPELKDFPYLWQQVEYVMGGGSTNFMFLVLAADQLLNK